MGIHPGVPQVISYVFLVVHCTHLYIQIESDHVE